ncbi:hypothetical protein NKJ48_31915 [Mesorhizobium sp. M0114]|uniref:hypothetical protein n=1 Tax=unclassified Mesorhizobium TaxID=325217 RepID=UPI00333AC8A3
MLMNIVGLIDERKDISLNEMMERLAVERSTHIGRSALSDWLSRVSQSWLASRPDTKRS